MSQSDIAMIGMAVMGENLALNIEEHGFCVSIYDIADGVVDRFLAGRGKGKAFVGVHSLAELVASLQKPRKIMMMIRAGSPVDEVIENLLPLLDKGDVVIDGGNSNFQDSQRRMQRVEQAGVYFIGTGVSGGEMGARNGPSMMPGGSPEAWPLVRPIFQAISAKVADGEACCRWVGSGGAGHFVKMVHNGVEYGDMQLICEAYALMKELLGMSAKEISDVFAKWNQGTLDSYLVEITAEILAFQDKDGSPLVDKILDTAGQKGTGKWACIAALDAGVPLTLISEAVFARCLSAAKEERVVASGVLSGPTKPFAGDREAFIESLEKALFASKIISYAQGYGLMRAASKEYGWDLAFGDIALMWRGGCIIRSAFLGEIKEAFDRDPALMNLMLDDYFSGILADAQQGWRNVCATAIISGIPIPAMTAALSYYDGYRSKQLPANLLQAQRDYFGTHTYERVDGERGVFVHTDWTGMGGSTGSTTYNA